jgi:hypothetical protein
MDELYFSFVCPTCGEYEMPEGALRGFVSEEMNDNLDRAVEEGASGAALVFEGQCPKCKPGSEFRAKLLALRKRQLM